MKLNFKKISAIGLSVITAGLTLGAAAAASYPAPFVQNGAANAAIVYGTGVGVSDLDQTQALNIQTSLASFVKGGTSEIKGENVGLASGSTKIFLNTSLNAAKTILTKSDLPTVLEQTTFSGNVDSKLTSTITIGSNKVTFAKQPSSNEDPVIGITTSTSSSDPLYTASVTMPAINFTSTDSQGETIRLFGRDFVVSTATDASNLVLFSSAQESTLTLGGDSPNPSTSVTIGGTNYNVELVTGSDTTATVSVNGVSKEITEGASKKIGGIDVAVKSVTSSAAVNTVVATLLIGSEKLTFTNNTQVTKGSDDDPIDGTKVTFTGTVDALTGLSVAVYAPDSSNDAILAGDSFKDPVFGSFSTVFKGLSSPLNDADRETISIDKSGDKGMSLTLTDNNGNEGTFDFIRNATTTFLGDSNGYTIANQEGATLYENNYTMIGNEEYGHLIQLTRIYNNTGSDYSKDVVKFRDVITGDTYSMDSVTSEGSGKMTIDGRQYDVTYSGSGDSGTVTLAYPTTSKHASGNIVVFPTMKTEKGALVSLYEPQTITLTDLDGKSLLLPNGDGYTSVGLTYANDTNGSWWDISGAGSGSLNTSSSSSSVSLTVGQLTYDLNGTSANVTKLYLVNPSTSVEISTPGVVVFEGKDDGSNYEAIIAYTDVSAGTSSDPVGIGTVVSTSPTWYSKSLQSDSDITQSVDWWGTLVTEDSNTASQKTVTISYPKEQVYADIAIAEAKAVTQTGALGNILVKDSEVNSVKDKNLIIVGGSCINSAAATALGVSPQTCGSAFTEATGVGFGQFLIKGVQDKFSTGKLALVVAGYDAADTVNAATYLTKKDVDTSKTYKGTSATEATLVVA